MLDRMKFFAKKPWQRVLFMSKNIERWLKDWHTHLIRTHYDSIDGANYEQWILRNSGHTGMRIENCPICSGSEPSEFRVKVLWPFFQFMVRHSGGTLRFRVPKDKFQWVCQQGTLTKRIIHHDDTYGHELVKGKRELI